MGKGSKSSSSDSDEGSSSNSESESSSISSPKSKKDGSPVSSPPSDGKKKRLEDIKPCWEENPDVYGIRRSGRSRKEPERLSATSPTSDSETGKSKNFKKDRKRSRQRSERSNTGVSSGSESGSSFEVPVTKGKRAPPQKNSRKSSKVKKSSKPPPRATRNVNLSESSEASSDSSEEPVARSRNKTRRAATKVNYREVSEDDGEEGDGKSKSSKKSKKNGEQEDHLPGLRPPPPDEGGECIEKVMDRRIGRPTAVGASTTMYSTAKNGDPNEGFDPNCGHGEEQYLIKWKGWSHLHNTWESLRSLRDQNVRGMKKLENYIRREEEINIWKARANPEDVEYLECQRDLIQELAETYVNVERVISSFEKPGCDQPDYLIKWENIPYSECTWEDGSLIEGKWADEIGEYRRRDDSHCVPNTNHRYLRSRPKFVPIKEQPEFLGQKNNLKLRDYQLTGLNWLVNSWCRNNSVILADEMGLGKTIQVICFLAYLFKTYELYGPFLLVVPLSTMTAWQREFTNWFPDMNVIVYIGDVSSRNTIRAVEWLLPEGGKLKFNAVLTTYEILLKDKHFLLSVDWAVLVVDEAHRLKNDDSLLYRSLKDFNTSFRCLVTGTPLQNSLKELWALLHFIMPEKFDYWEEFEREHAEEKAKNMGYKGLHKQLEPFILRRVKKDVERSLPAKVEQILRVDMTSQQRQFYKWILTKNFEQLRKGNRGSLTTFTNIIVELKKCCNHAFLTKPADDVIGLSAMERIQRLIRGSGKLLLLDKLLVRLRETGHRVLIFSQMVRMLDILSEYLMLRHFPFQRLDGGIKGELRRQALDHFNAEGSPDFCFLLSTRAGGLGINLATADTVIIFDSDWNPQNDLQAQSRAHRIGQKNQVNIYRLVTKASVEENIIERAKKKMILDHLVIQNMDTTGSAILDRKTSANSSVPFNKEELTAILKFGAEELFKDDEQNDEELACDIDDILRRAETRDEEPRIAGDELLSQFKVTSFVFDEEEENSLLPEKKVDDEDEETKDWSDIIPETFRKTLEDREKEKEMADLYLPPRNRKSKLRSSDKKADDEESEEEDEEDDEDEDDSEEEAGRKKRGRKGKELVKGFTAPEIRRFVKSWRKFPSPMSRLDSIAVDAELEEKSSNDLKRLGETLISKCKEALEQQAGEEVGKKSRGPKIQVGGVSLNARSLLSQMDELKPLESLPADKKERSTWMLDAKVKACHWDCEWAREDDSRLLQGIYEYGMGSWEAIKADPSLKLENKILPEDGKPNEKQLQTRAEYLIRAMAKHSPSIAAKDDKSSPRKGGRKPKTKAYIEEDNISSDEDKPPQSLSNADHHHVKHKQKSAAGVTAHGGEREGSHDHEEKKGKKDKEHKEHKVHKKHHHHHHHKNKKKEVEQPSSGPVPLHFTTHETVAINVMGELSEETFKECKEKMRPVKKSLKQLGNPDPSLSEKDLLIHTRQCLRLIGDHINSCLMIFHDPEKIREWRSNLWFFVSKFTEFDAPKLYKLYKKAKEKDNDETAKKPKKSSPGSSKPSPAQKRKAPVAGKAPSRPTSTGPAPAKRPFASSSSTVWNKKKREEDPPKPDAAKNSTPKDNRRSMSPPEVDHVLPPVGGAASASASVSTPSSTSNVANTSCTYATARSSSTGASHHHPRQHHPKEADPELEEGEMRDEEPDRDRMRDRERAPADYQPRRRVDDDPRWRDYARYQERHADARRDRDGYTDAYYRGTKARPPGWPPGYAHMPMTVPHAPYYPQHGPPGPSSFRSFPRDRRDPRGWDRDKKLGPP